MNENLIIDTNALIYSIKNKIDIREKLLYLPYTFNIYVPECVISELRGLSRSHWYAKAALQLGLKFNLLRSQGRGDDCILEMAMKINAFVLTNDRGLISRLRDHGIKILIISGEKRIHFYK
ncbi:type II toxin-antitoxin system VapC family toxin [Picrophilus oshimae]|uniref:Hypothetical RNAse (Contains PIN domain) n=1 Tax=Picrophilus torridus (strain ATCC 700027 / DSM 9790 / JCM 10055 / NBRC 100828 / KAW 2/3) TaxID=1122961 RepID=Q6L0E7_PICTO|nr:PIN domain-containing protein [Picrophilus oshimae]AAT43555.1 hypothetical RNAse (contains PIN domain) [Picrophilus oshimae DSM 9789]SMD31179.1 SSU processome protein Utp24 [Picrophilus oshimae DSM 9789]